MVSSIWLGFARSSRFPLIASNFRTQTKFELFSSFQDFKLFGSIAGVCRPEFDISCENQGLENWKPKRGLLGENLNRNKQKNEKKGKRGNYTNLSGKSGTKLTEPSVLSQLENLAVKDGVKACKVAFETVIQEMQWEFPSTDYNETKKMNDAGWLLWNAIQWYRAEAKERDKLKDSRETTKNCSGTKTLEISLLLCSDSVIAEFNKDFRGKPPGTPTDVLSFPALRSFDEDPVSSELNSNDRTKLVDQGVERLFGNKVSELGNNSTDLGTMKNSSDLPFMPGMPPGEAPVLMSLSNMNSEELRKHGLSEADVKEFNEILKATMESGENLDHIFELGNIIISAETAEAQAARHGIHTLDEIRILYIHGLLHIFGFDHCTDKGFQQMAKLESLILKKLEWKGQGLCNLGEQTVK